MLHQASPTQANLYWQERCLYWELKRSSQYRKCFSQYSFACAWLAWQTISTLNSFYTGRSVFYTGTCISAETPQVEILFHSKILITSIESALPSIGARGRKFAPPSQSYTSEPILGGAFSTLGAKAKLPVQKTPLPVQLCLCMIGLVEYLNLIVSILGNSHVVWNNQRPRSSCRSNTFAQSSCL